VSRDEDQAANAWRQGTLFGFLIGVSDGDTSVLAHLSFAQPHILKNLLQEEEQRGWSMAGKCGRPLSVRNGRAYVGLGIFVPGRLVAESAMSLCKTRGPDQTFWGMSRVQKVHTALSLVTM
jgi:hypothetical protein